MTTPEKKRGAMNTTLTAVLALASFAGAVVAPTLYIGGIKEVNSVQDTKIENLKEDVDKTDGAITALQASVAIAVTKTERMEYLEGKLDRLLEGEGWNPKNIEEEINRRLKLKSASSTEITTAQ